jgi:hypothetical protein
MAVLPAIIKIFFNLNILRRKNRNMKKLLLLALLLGLMALPGFASDISFGGDLTYGFIRDFEEDATLTTSTTANFDIKATIDDYNSLKIEYDLFENNVDYDELADEVDLHVDKAYCTTDIGALFELPVGLKLDWGNIKPNANRFSGVSERGNEKIYNFERLYWGFNLLATIQMAEIELAVEPGNGRLIAGVAVKEPIAGLNAELYYYQGHDTDADVFDQGSIGFSMNYAAEFSGFALKVGAGLEYLLTEGADMKFGAGLSGTYSIAKLTVGYNGNASEAAEKITATVAVTPVDMATIYVGLEADLTQAAKDAVEAKTRNSALNGVDMGAQIKFGACSVYLGYLLTDVGGGKWKAPAANTNGGIYIKCDIDY